MDINKLVRRNVQQLKPYSSARDEFEGEASVFLDANENPYPTDYNRYPDPHQKKLKRRISLIKNVKEDQIFIGNGSDEAIDLLFRVFCEPGVDEALIPQPTYGMYAVSAAINDVKIKSVNLTDDFDVNVISTLSAASLKTKLLFLCSPNNPSGNLLSHERVAELIEKFQGMVIVDEAYIDFSSQPGFAPLLSKYKNLVVLQTLSKAWGLAGLRLGLAFANPEIISLLDKIKPPYNINSVSQSIALKKLVDEDSKDNQVKEILWQREILSNQLKKLGLVERVYPSEANFLLVKIKNARQVYELLIKKEIVVRDRSNVILCDQCLRITVGTPDENQKLIEELGFV
jgi:histidinol-phosphate aminotransferase